MTVESPLCPFTKMLVNVVRKRLTDQVEAKNILCIDQAGFRRDREVLDHMYTLTETLNRRARMPKYAEDTHLMFIDLQKAYDKVDRRLLLAKLKFYGVEGQMLGLLSSYYEGDRICIKDGTDGQTTRAAPITCGVKQGCPLSPILFNLFLNDLLFKIRRLDCGVNIPRSKMPHVARRSPVSPNDPASFGPELLSTLPWADDMVVVTNSYR